MRGVNRDSGKVDVLRWYPKARGQGASKEGQFHPGEQDLSVPGREKLGQRGVGMTGKVSNRNKISTKKHTARKITPLTSVLKEPDMCLSPD